MLTSRTWCFQQGLQGVNVDAAVLPQLVFPVGYTPVFKAAHPLASSDANDLFQCIVRAAETAQNLLTALLSQKYSNSSSFALVSPIIKICAI